MKFPYALLSSCYILIAAKCIQATMYVIIIYYTLTCTHAAPHTNILYMYSIATQTYMHVTCWTAAWLRAKEKLRPYI